MVIVRCTSDSSNWDTRNTGYWWIYSKHWLLEDILETLLIGRYTQDTAYWEMNFRLWLLGDILETMVLRRKTKHFKTIILYQTTLRPAGNSNES
jgi:hypothetical protein